MIVVKLGGSLAEGGTVRAWLATIAEHGRGRVVVVPGGGPFAETVRTAQRSLGFSDEAAHRMAVMAMDQYAVLLADLEPALVPCTTAAAIVAACRGGGVALWLPSFMVLSAPEIAASWDVTSDSIAAWLARRLGAERLVLVKSAPPPDVSIDELSASGFVDRALPGFLAGGGLPLTLAGPDDRPRFGSALRAAA